MADDIDAESAGGGRCCPVCTEPAEWVAVGPCGHRQVCVDCAVRMRFFHKNLRCCICRAHCPSVVITKQIDAGNNNNGFSARASTTAAFGGAGRVGVYFSYHSGAAAYFDDQQQYEKVMRNMCLELEKQPPPPAGVVEEEDDPRQEACPDPMLLWLSLVYIVAVTLVGTAVIFPLAMDVTLWSHRVGVVIAFAFFWAVVAHFTRCSSPRKS